ncbi:MAG: hypothetical protein NTY19_14185, partial [Planctomycetota bacterium]|nr:hypothetical protein [Planctomycetota bacterium]
MIPPDVEWFNTLFETALKGSALEMGDVLGIKTELERFEVGMAPEEPTTLTTDALRLADAAPASAGAANAFWRDFAQFEPGQGKKFRSVNFAEASHNFPEMMLALAVLDLPFAADKHETKFDQAQMTLTPGSPLILFHEEIKQIPAAKEQTPILVSQNFFRHGDRTQQVNNEQVDKFVTEEFLVGVVYGC